MYYVKLTLTSGIKFYKSERSTLPFVSTRHAVHAVYLIRYTAHV